MTAAPLCVLPSKDTVEELFFKSQEKGMTSRQNFFVTFILVVINTVLALFIDTIGDAMTLVGSSINPIIGFILPIVFYWPFMKHKPWYSFDKVVSVFSAFVIISVSILSLYQFFSTVG